MITTHKLLQRFNASPAFVRALILLFASMVCFAISVAMIKKLGQQLHVAEIIALRQIFLVLALAPAFMRSPRQQLTVRRVDLLLLRTSIAFVSILCGFTAIIHLPLATATTLSFSRTFFITVFAVLILKEAVGPRRIGALLVGFIGILVIARPLELLSNGLTGLDINIILAVVSSAGIGMGQIIIRIQARYDTPTRMVIWQAVLIGLAMAPIAYWNWITPTWNQWGILVLVGSLTSFAQWSAVSAFKLAEATFLAPFDYLRLVFSTGLGWLIFSEWPDAYTWLGAAIIFLSTFYIIRREASLKRTRTED